MTNDEEIPNTLPLAEHDKFLAPDVAAFVNAISAPLFNYRMARGQLGRSGFPRRLRKHEAELRALALIAARLENYTLQELLTELRKRGDANRDKPGAKWLLDRVEDTQETLFPYLHQRREWS